jgi:hypothetical protein
MNLVNPTVSVGSLPSRLADRLDPVPYSIKAAAHSFVVWHHHADSSPRQVIDFFIGTVDIQNKLPGASGLGPAAASRLISGHAVTSML